MAVSAQTRLCRRCKSPVAVTASACDFCGAYLVELSTGGSNREAIVLAAAGVLMAATFTAILVPLGKVERESRRARAAEWAREHPEPSPEPALPSPEPAASLAPVASGSLLGPDAGLLSRETPLPATTPLAAATAPVLTATVPEVTFGLVSRGLAPGDAAPVTSPATLTLPPAELVLEDPTPLPVSAPSPSPATAPPPPPAPSPAPSPTGPVAVADLSRDEHVWDGHQWQRTQAGHRHSAACGHFLVGERWQQFPVEPRIYDGPVQDFNLKRPDDGLYEFQGRVYWLRDHVHAASCGHRYGVYGWYLPEAP